MKTPHLKFPPRRKDVEGQWAPLMFEPILGSGERFTVAIVAMLNGEVYVEPAPALQRFECLYGSASTDVLVAIQITLDEIKARAQILTPDTLFGAELASNNAVLGEKRPGNGSSVEEVMEGALRLSSSFANWTPKGHLKFLKTMDFEVDGLERIATTASGSHETQLVKQVFGYVGQRDQRLRSAFSRRFRASKSGRTSKIDFAGNRLIANLRQLHTGRHLSTSVDRGKAGLLDLEVYRAEHRQSLFPASQHALFLHVPSRDTRPDLSSLQAKHIDEAVEELTAIALKRELEAFTYTSVHEIGEAILHTEAPLIDTSS